MKPGGWGATTRNGNTIYVHVLDPTLSDLALPLAKPVRSAHLMKTQGKVDYTLSNGVVLLRLPARAKDEIDQIIVLDLAP